MSLQLYGDDKLLARIGKAKNPRALTRVATRAGAKLVAEQVRADLPKRTGATAKNVKVRSAGKQGTKVVVGIPGTETYRGWFLERGTKPRFTKKHAYRGQMKPGNYVEKATNKVAEQVLGTVKDIIAAKVFE